MGHGNRQRENRGDFNRQRGFDEQPYQQQRASRPPLEWLEVHKLSNNGVEARISKAINDAGEPMYSFQVGRAPRGDKPGSKFIQARDIAYLREMADQVEQWIEADARKSAA